MEKIAIKRIYVAGPYSQGDMDANVNLAIAYGHNILDMGLSPFVPHLAHYMHLIKRRDYEDWMNWDLTWLEKCDALIRIPGPSPGADREVTRAHELGIPVFGSLTDLKQYITS